MFVEVQEGLNHRPLLVICNSLPLLDLCPEVHFRRSGLCFQDLLALRLNLTAAVY